MLNETTTPGGGLAVADPPPVLPIYTAPPVVHRVWGRLDPILLIFAGSAAEFALNKAVDWLFWTNRLPRNPLQDVRVRRAIVERRGHRAATAVGRAQVCRMAAGRPVRAEPGAASLPHRRRRKATSSAPRQPPARKPGRRRPPPRQAEASARYLLFFLFGSHRLLEACHRICAQRKAPEATRVGKPKQRFASGSMRSNCDRTVFAKPFSSLTDRKSPG